MIRWLDDSIRDEEICIDGYKCIRLDRNRHGGGIIIFAQESILSKYSTYLFSDNLELACIEICLPKQKPFLLIYWYRPPDSHNDIFDKVEHLLENVEDKNTDYILIGDLNCDLNKTPKAHHTNRLLRIAEEYELEQFVEKHTRVTATTSTLIDILRGVITI